MRKLDEETRHWCYIPDCSDVYYRHTSNDGQILAFEEAGVMDDTGEYLCNATNGRITISRTFSVRVVGEFLCVLCTVKI